MAENDDAIAGQLYAESIRLRKVADLLVEKSELISKCGFAPNAAGKERMAQIDQELEALKWSMPED